MEDSIAQSYGQINPDNQTIDLFQIKVTNEEYLEYPISLLSVNVQSVKRVIRCGPYADQVKTGIEYFEETPTQVLLCRPSGQMEFEIDNNLRVKLGLDYSTLLQPVIGHSGGYNDISHELQINPNGVLRQIDRRNMSPSEHNRTPKKIVPKQSDSWLAIVGRNGVYLVECNSFSYCSDPVVIVTQSHRYLMLASEEQEIILGEGGHLVLIAFDVVVIIVGRGGFNESDLSFNRVLDKFHAGIDEYPSIHLRAYRGLDENNESVYTLIQVCDNVSLVYNMPIEGLSERVFRDTNPFLLAIPLLEYYSLPMFSRGVTRDQDLLLRMTDSHPIGYCCRLERVTVDCDGNYVDVNHSPEAIPHNSSEIRPLSGTLIVLSWNGEALELAAGRQACLYVVNTIVVFKPSSLHENLVESDSLMKVFETRNQITLNAGLVHVCFLTRCSAILLSGDENYATISDNF